MDAYDTLSTFGGIASRSQLLASGQSGTDLTRAVRLGRIWRVRRAYYATREALPTAIQAVRVGGRLCGLSAASSYGLWSGTDVRVHVAVPTNAARLRTNFPPSTSDHLTPDISQQDIVLHWIDSEWTECWRVSLFDCLRQAVRWADRETAVACLDTARSAFGLTVSQLAAIFDGTPIEDRLISTRSRNGSDAGTESLVRQRLLRCGVRVRQQIEIPGVGRVDMGIVGTRIIIEVDGHAYRASREAFENDRRRDAELTKRGYVIIRLSYEQVMSNWAWCERMILDTLSQFRK